MLAASPEIQKETIIEKEIKEQQKKEDLLRTEGQLHAPSHTNKVRKIDISSIYTVETA